MTGATTNTKGLNCEILTDPVLQTNEKNDKESMNHCGSETAGKMFDTWSYETDQYFSLDALRQMVRKELPASIYRCKVIVYIADSPNIRHTLQAVGRRTEVTIMDEWAESTPFNQIVAIGEAGGFDSLELTKKFYACIERVSI